MPPDARKVLVVNMQSQVCADESQQPSRTIGKHHHFYVIVGDHVDDSLFDLDRLHSQCFVTTRFSLYFLNVYGVGRHAQSVLSNAGQQRA